MSLMDKLKTGTEVVDTKEKTEDKIEDNRSNIGSEALALEVSVIGDKLSTLDTLLPELTPSDDLEQVKMMLNQVIKVVNGFI